MRGISAAVLVLAVLSGGCATTLSKEQQDIVVKGYESNYSLINLVNDLLDVARLEEGRFGFDSGY